MKTISELLIRCPQCGNIPTLVYYPRGVLRPRPTEYSVECRQCHISGHMRFTEEDAIKTWNKLRLEEKNNGLRN